MAEYYRVKQKLIFLINNTIKKVNNIIIPLTFAYRLNKFPSKSDFGKISNTS